MGVNTPLPALTGSSPQNPLQFERPKRQRLWKPKQAIITAASLEHPHLDTIRERLDALEIPTKILKGNAVRGIKGETEQETYRLAKSTLVVAVAPPSQFKLQPIPPSADYQFHLAQGCPAHCQYCYLAGSLGGPPLTRAYANMDDILANLGNYLEPEREVSFEVSCYTDPLALEHLTGSLSACIEHFGKLNGAKLRYVSKFSNIEPFLDLEHNGHTRARASINAAPVERLEGGTASVRERLDAIRQLALPKSEGGGGYPVGLVIAPIMPGEGWREEYGKLFEQIEQALDFDCDLTFELITHRFTPKSKTVLQGWYPATKLDLDEANRSVKRNKFGGTKYVYPKNVMSELREFFESELSRRFPKAEILYWT